MADCPYFNKWDTFGLSNRLYTCGLNAPVSAEIWRKLFDDFVFVGDFLHGLLVEKMTDGVGIFVSKWDTGTMERQSIKLRTGKRNGDKSKMHLTSGSGIFRDCCQERRACCFFLVWGPSILLSTPHNFHTNGRCPNDGSWLMATAQLERFVAAGQWISSLSATNTGRAAHFVSKVPSQHWKSVDISLIGHVNSAIWWP